MQWNWQQADWPNFRYDAAALHTQETEFTRESGIILGAFKHLSEEDKDSVRIELISNEALKTSEIEGELLDRNSLQSSIRRQFGLETDGRKVPPAEQGIAEMMIDLYHNFSAPLSHEELFQWHRLLTNGRQDLKAIGAYRTHPDPMQVVSGAIHRPKIHFEAPPSAQVTAEMQQFVEWFNHSERLPALTRSGIAHLYFVCIHPFEDGNGRIGRGIAEKALAQSIGQPSLIALAAEIQKNRNAYYEALEAANRQNEITPWLVYFADVILKAQKRSLASIEFLIRKTRLYDRLRGQLNARQEKVLERIFREGVDGFAGGLSAKNYITIAQTSTATATRDLRDLVQRGALTQTGQLKSTRYWLAKE